MCNALDGSEDCLACGDAASLWADMGTPAKREAAIRDVDASFAAGAISWDAVQDFVHAPPHVAGLSTHTRRGRTTRGRRRPDSLGPTDKIRL